MHRAGKFHLQREKLFQPFLTIPCAPLFSMHFFSALCLFRSRWKLSSKLCNMNQSHSVEKVQWNYLCHCFLCVQRHKNGGHKDWSLKMNEHQLKTLIANIAHGASTRSAPLLMGNKNKTEKKQWLSFLEPLEKRESIQTNVNWWWIFRNNSNMFVHTRSPSKRWRWIDLVAFVRWNDGKWLRQMAFSWLNFTADSLFPSHISALPFSSSPVITE